MNLKSRYIWIILIILGVIFSWRLTALTSVLLQKNTLPHYEQAQSITEDYYNNIKIDSTGIIRARNLIEYPEILEAAEKNGVIEKNAEFSVGSLEYPDGAPWYENVESRTGKHKVLIVDLVDKTIYYMKTHGNSDTQRQFNLIDLTTSVESVVTIPWNSDFIVGDRLACFSCGCSCYVTHDPFFAKNKTYIHARGEDYALRKDKQGLFYLDEGTEWKKLTPQIDKVKIHSNGCEAAYKLGQNYFNLNVCNL